MAETEARKCRGVDCPKDAGTLQCPTCLKSGVDSFFCSQDCFKRSWVSMTDSKWRMRCVVLNEQSCTNHLL